VSDVKDQENIILALDTLASFPFSGTFSVLQALRSTTQSLTKYYAGYQFSEFVRDCLLSYIEEDSVEIRKAAALACCKLLGKESMTSAEVGGMINEILEKLLTTGIADPGGEN
jgi:phosphatidylinositol kinase/protein kinase (PI-3  family)